MTKRLHIHPVNPQSRLLQQAIGRLNSGGVIAMPVDSGYVLAVKIDNKKGLDKIASIRGLDNQHLFSLLCSNLSSISTYARVDNSCYRLLKSALPGGYTFILTASQKLPRRLLQNKRKTIGIRIPDALIAQKILEIIDEPLLVSSLVLMDDEENTMSDPDELYEHTAHQIDCFVDGGYVSLMPTSIVDLSDGFPATIIREGLGDTSLFK